MIQHFFWVFQRKATKDVLDSLTPSDILSNVSLQCLLAFLELSFARFFENLYDSSGTAMTTLWFTQRLELKRDSGRIT